MFGCFRLSIFQHSRKCRKNVELDVSGKDNIYMQAEETNMI